VSDTAVPLRVLVADDEESLRFFLERSLRRLGYAVDTVADGRAAIERIAHNTYDVVLADVVMPGATGIDVLAAVHRMDKDSVVLLMTAHGTVENAIDALRKGASDYLTKPFELNELVVRIERGLDRRAVERENRKLRFLVEHRQEEEHEEDGMAAARREWEREYVADLLRKTHGNVTRAAEMARISRPNLHKKIRALDLNPSDFKR
jgi:two-component system, NtrC family, nitrogen regulation response regulator GlnG